MRYYLSRKTPSAGTVHIVSHVGSASWSLCNREGPWPRGLFWWVVAGYPVCKHCKRQLAQILKEVENRKKAVRRLEGINHD